MIGAMDNRFSTLLIDPVDFRAGKEEHTSPCEDEIPKSQVFEVLLAANSPPSSSSSSKDEISSSPTASDRIPIAIGTPTIMLNPAPASATMTAVPEKGSCLKRIIAILFFRKPKEEKREKKRRAYLTANECVDRLERMFFSSPFTGAKPEKKIQFPQRKTKTKSRSTSPSRVNAIVTIPPPSSKSSTIPLPFFGPRDHVNRKNVQPLDSRIRDSKFFSTSSFSSSTSSTPTITFTNYEYNCLLASLRRLKRRLDHQAYLTTQLASNLVGQFARKEIMITTGNRNPMRYSSKDVAAMLRGLGLGRQTAGRIFHRKNNNLLLMRSNLSTISQLMEKSFFDGEKKGDFELRVSSETVADLLQKIGDGLSMQRIWNQELEIAVQQGTKDRRWSMYVADKIMVERFVNMVRDAMERLEKGCYSEIQKNVKVVGLLMRTVK